MTDARLLFQRDYDDLFRYLYTYVSFRVPHQQESEDLVAQIMLKAWEKVEQFDAARGSLRMWVTGIARFTVIDYWRSKKMVFGLEEIPATFLLDDTYTPDPEQLDAAAWFEQIMEQLPADVRALCALRYIDGLTYAEIADMTAKKPATIRKLFSTLHARLRDQLQSEVFDPTHTYV